MKPKSTKSKSNAHPYNRKLYGLRYRMRKRGYIFDPAGLFATLPMDAGKRSLLQERRIQAFGYHFYYNIFSNDVAPSGDTDSSLTIATS